MYNPDISHYFIKEGSLEKFIAHVQHTMQLQFNI